MAHVAEAIYILCTVTSLACALLLARAYMQSRMRILLWSTLCFFLLAINNVILFLDLVIFVDLNLTPLRDVTSLGAVAVLVFGLIWDGD